MKDFKVYSVCRIDFKEGTYDSERFFNDAEDAENFRDDLIAKSVDNQDILYIVEYCNRSTVV